MAEYSKLAQGSFPCVAQTQAIYLPFVPDYVRVTNIGGVNNTGAATGSVETIEWVSCMPQGDGIISQVQSGGYLRPVSAAPNGIRTFSQGSGIEFGPQMQITSMTTASPVVVTTAGNHNLSVGDIVMFEGIEGMLQIAGMQLAVFAVASSTSFSIYFTASASVFSAVSTGYVKKVLNPYLYAPNNGFISSIGNGTQTTVNLMAPINVVVGQEVGFRIPSYWGSNQLNSNQNPMYPGSPKYGIVTQVVNPLQFLVNINSSSFINWTYPPYFPGMQFPQVYAVGDVNSGGWPYTGTSLYPSPIVNGANTINGPAIYGSFVNNTRQGFSVGSSILTSGVVGNSTYFWEACAHDYLQYNSVGIAVS